MIRLFTSFSGYDSQLLAMRRAGVETELVGWSEIDQHAIKAHNALFPEYADRNYGNICDIDWVNVPDFDFFTYSSPCQDFSIAGMQRGGAEGSGTRSSLLWECRKAIEIKRPKYLLMENVANLVSQKFIGVFNAWLATLSKFGYTNFAKVLNAKDYGVPQNRERIFVVSIHDCDRAFYFPKPVKLTKCIKDMLEENVPERYYLSDERVCGLIDSTAKEAWNGRNFAFAPKDQTDIANSVTSMAGSRKTDNFIKVVGNTQENRHQSGAVYDSEGVRPCICNCEKAAVKITEPSIIQVGNLVDSGNYDNPNRGRVYSTDGILPTIDCMGGGDEKRRLSFLRDAGTSGHEARVRAAN